MCDRSGRFTPSYDGNKFNCPWSNERRASTWKIILYHLLNSPGEILSKEKNESLLLSKEINIQERSEKLIVTWISHACLLIQINFINIITDPVFSEFLLHWAISPRRLASNGLKIDQLPPIDVVMISHNHYDHLDYNSVYTLYQKYPCVKFLVPLKVKKTFVDYFKISGENVEEFSWWDETILSPKLKAAFVPAQHWSRRGLFDENATLWGGWCVIGEESSFFFAGDTGYYKELFQQIGEAYGPFDVAAIPIGAYEPRKYLKFVHLNPNDALNVHVDIKSKHSIGIHWATFILGCEGTITPKIKLEMEKANLDLKGTTFDCVLMGQSIDKDGRVLS